MGRHVVRALVLALVLSWSIRSAAVPVTSRTPNIDSPDITPAITGDFLFDHRFQDIDDKIINSPTFSLDVGLLPRLSLGIRYASNSDVNASINELEALAKVVVLHERDHWVDLTGIAAYSNASGSLDLAAVVARRVGFVSVLAEPRFFSDGYGHGGATFAGGVGLQIHINRYLLLAGDVNAVLAADHWDAIKATSDRVAWSGAMAFQIPQTPHSVSIYATNGNTVTLQGESRGTQFLRIGFAFDIPLTGLSRWGSIFHPPPESPSSEPTGGPTAEVAMQSFQYQPQRLTVKAGTTVRFTNHDSAVHTVTAADGSWDSGDIAAGGAWSRRFDRPGTYPYVCTLHPGMQGVIVVE